MKKLKALYTIGRFHNAAMTAVAVALGFWFSGALNPDTIGSMILLMIAAVCATAFGNVINDIKDIATDTINRPDRPLPRGDLDTTEAMLFAVCLAFSALILSCIVSFAHCAGVAVPLSLLVLYTAFLKGTPLAGNIVVSIMVGYAILFGAIGGPSMNHLFLPALCAFLANLSREIVKDLQDIDGDTKVGYKTTAHLPKRLVHSILLLLGIGYAGAIFMPFRFGHFGSIYLGFCAGLILPLEISRLFYFFNAKSTAQLAQVSFFSKIELLAGLAAMVADKIIT